MPIEAVIFDMDGVLVDSEQYWWESRQDFAAATGRTWTMDDQRACMGRSTHEWGQVMIERLALDLPLDEVIRRTKAGVLARFEARLPLLPAALESVHLAASAYRVGLASGSPTEIIERVMALTGLDKVFEVIVYGDDMQHGKPAPDIYLEAARRLGVEPSRCVGIEDSGNGIRALKAAGMFAIAAPSPGFPLPPEIVALADRQIASLTEFDLALVRSFDDAK